MRSSWILGLVGGLGAGISCSPGAFTCSDDAQCQGEAVDGVCVEGHCAFPNDDCDSGLAFGEHAGGLAGSCVAVDGTMTDTDTGGPMTTAMDSVTATSMGPGPDTLDTGMDSTTDGPPFGQVEFTDDELAGEFEAGTFEQTTWFDERLALDRATSSGTFTSRVFDAGAVAQWETLTWQPDGPYGKPLPDEGALERGYAVGGVTMADNVLLMHFDGDGVWDDGMEVRDASGAESHGTVVSDGGPIALIDGVFGTALDDHPASYVSIPTAEAPGLAFGEDDFTWALWVRMDDPCTQNHVYMGVDNSGSSEDLWPHLWLGCTDDGWDECPGTVGRPRGAGVLRSQHSIPDDGAFYCSGSALDDAQWHHMVVTKEGHANGVVRLFLDGQLEYEGGGSFAGPMEYPDEPDFAIGAFSRGTYPAEADFDEAAIWSRALSPEEVLSMYRRGVLRLRVLVRVCTEAGCSDDPPFAKAWSDPADALAPGAVVPLDGFFVGRYIQYRVEMERPDGQPSPRLGSVTLRGVI